MELHSGRIYYLFRLLLQAASLRENCKNGFAMSHFVVEYMLSGFDNFVNRIMGDYRNMSNEIRINGAGLKLYYRVNQKENLIYFFIGGDQVNDYPEFVSAAREILKRERADRESYDRFIQRKAARLVRKAMEAPDVQDEIDDRCNPNFRKEVK